MWVFNAGLLFLGLGSHSWCSGGTLVQAVDANPSQNSHGPKDAHLQHLELLLHLQLVPVLGPYEP